MRLVPETVAQKNIIYVLNKWFHFGITSEVVLSDNKPDSQTGRSHFHSRPPLPIPVISFVWTGLLSPLVCSHLCMDWFALTIELRVSRSSVARASDRCVKGNGFDSCRKIRFFLCPTFVT